MPGLVGDNGSVSKPEADEVRIRRAPKFGAFVVVGAAVGAIVTLIVTAQFPADPAVGFGALFAYFCLYGVTAGAALGAVIAIVLDRILARRAKTVEAEREVVPPEQDDD